MGPAVVCPRNFSIREGETGASLQLTASQPSLLGEPRPNETRLKTETKNKLEGRGREMAQQLRSPAAPEACPGSVPSTHIRQLTTYVTPVPG